MANSSSSDITNTLTNKNINQSTIESINKNTSKIMTETVVSNQTTSKGAYDQYGEIIIGKIQAIGPGSDISGLNILIEQNATVNFSANDTAVQDNIIMADYAIKLVEQLQNTITNDQAAKLASEGKAKQTSDIFSTNFLSNVDSSVNNRLTQINKNTNYTKILNDVANTIEQNSKTLNFKDCIMTNLQRGSLNIGEITAADGGKISNVTLGIKQSIDIIQNCIFNTIQTSNITSKIVQDFGFTVTNDTSNKQSGESEAKSSAEQENKGLSDLVKALTGPSLYSLIAIGLLIVLASIFLALRYSMSGKALAKEGADLKTALDSNLFSGSFKSNIFGKKKGMGIIQNN
jgi:hypothetical protein